MSSALEMETEISPQVSKHRMRFTAKEFKKIKEEPSKNDFIQSTQQSKCKGCLKDFTRSFSLRYKYTYDKAQFCTYTGFYYCTTCCSQNRQSIIPAYVVGGWHFKEHPVCDEAYEFIQQIWSQPIVCVAAVNPALFDRVVSVNIAHQIRTQLHTFFEFCRGCPKFSVLLDGFKENRYLLENTEMYSLENLSAMKDCPLLQSGQTSLPPEITARIGQDEFISTLKVLRSSCVQHVMHLCPDVCKISCERTCQHCHKSKVEHQDKFFVFDSAKATRCKQCGAFYHRECFSRTPCDCGALHESFAKHEIDILTPRPRPRSISSQERSRGDPTHESITDEALQLNSRMGWRFTGQAEDCSMESMSVEYCDKKALRVTCEIRTNLDRFKEVILDSTTLSKVDPSLLVLDVLKKFSNGVEVHYTAYKSPSKLVSPRDFISLMGYRELGPVEVVEYGLGTPGTRVFVVAFKPDTTAGVEPQDGFTRGCVYCYGHLAISRPEEPWKIELVTISSVDLSGWIPTWLLESTNIMICKKLARIRALCEGVDYMGTPVGSDLQPPAARNEDHREDPSADDAVTTNTRTVGEEGTSQENEKDVLPSIEGVCQQSFDLMSRPGWRNVGVVENCLVEDLQVEFCSKKAWRITTTMKCQLSTFRAFMTDGKNVSKYDINLEKWENVFTYSNGVSIYHTAYKSLAKVVAPRDFVVMSCLQDVTPDHCKALGFPGKKVFVISSVADCSGRVPESKNYVRGNVYVYGYIAIEDPMVPGEIRVIIVSAVDPCGWIPNWAMEIGRADMCKKVARIREIVESEPKQEGGRNAPSLDIDVCSPITPAPNGEEEYDEFHSPQQSPRAGDMVMNPNFSTNVKETPETEVTVVVDTSTNTVQQSTEEQTNVGKPEEVQSSCPYSHDKIVKTVLELYSKPGWKYVNTVEECSLEDVPVEYCDKKAIKIQTKVRCNAEKFKSFISDPNSIRLYDLTLDRAEVLTLYPNGVSVLYTGYKQAVRLIAARDFVVVNGQKALSAEEIRQYQFGDPDDLEVYVFGSIPGEPDSMPLQKNLTRGTVHVYGYLILEKKSCPGEITLFCVGAVDPAGKIPGWLVDAGNAENCKKLARIRKLCEEEK